METKLMLIIFQWIPGMMVGLEFPYKMVVLDLLIVRMMVLWDVTEEERKELEQEQ